MKKVRVTRYIADCGRGFWSKKSCERHEGVCKCWTNPNFKTCKTCKFCNVVNDSNGMDSEPQFLETWKRIECMNEKFVYDDHFNAAHEKAPDLNINCPVWVSK